MNIFVYILTKSDVSLGLGCFMLGGALIYAVTTPHINWQTRFIHKLIKDFDYHTKAIIRYYEKRKKGSAKTL